VTQRLTSPPLVLVGAGEVTGGLGREVAGAAAGADGSEPGVQAVATTKRRARSAGLVRRLRAGALLS
jgi:hypothetical protein